MLGLICNCIALACWWINFRNGDRRGDWLFAGLSLAMFVVMLCCLFVNISRLMGGEI